MSQEEENLPTQITEEKKNTIKGTLPDYVVDLLQVCTYCVCLCEGHHSHLIPTVSCYSYRLTMEMQFVLMLMI